MEKTIRAIQRSKDAKAYKKYIDYIRFPYYKNFRKDTKITLDFPLTVLVGPNGTGKSSILKALYGCIDGYSLGDYWFSTKVDTIEDLKDTRNCFIYNYQDSKSSDNQFEVLVQRTYRDNNPDVWEPSRPVQKYSMKVKKDDKNYRKSKIANEPLYIDFHSVLSAFDTYRYFLPRGNKSETNKYLRRKSNQLYNIINGRREPYTFKGYEHNKKPILLDDSQLYVISKILNKKYIKGKIIEHKFFVVWGTSVFLETDKYKYSDAFAGSGETAVAILVNKLHLAKEGSLVLLDEPEICLHPGAQKRLFEYLLSSCLQKKLQIIISTHSPELIKYLPNNAIKVFTELPNGEIEVTNENNSGSAFFYLGADNEHKKIIYVEDILGKTIIEKLSLDISESILDQIEVIVHPGGAESIKKSIAISSQLKENNKFFVLDGDKYKTYKDYRTLSLGDNLKDCLKEIIQEATDMATNKLFAANSNENEQTKIDRYEDFLEYWDSNVSFFPQNTPEEFIWNDDVLRKLLDDESLSESIISNSDYKTRFAKTSEALASTDKANDIFYAQQIFLKRWLKQKNSDFEYIKSRILEIVS